MDLTTLVRAERTVEGSLDSKYGRWRDLKNKDWNNKESLW